jgi:hypothetical protein
MLRPTVSEKHDAPEIVGLPDEAVALLPRMKKKHVLKIGLMQVENAHGAHKGLQQTYLSVLHRQSSSLASLQTLRADG